MERGRIRGLRWSVWVDLILGEFDFKWISGRIGVSLKVRENDVV